MKLALIQIKGQYKLFIDQYDDLNMIIDYIRNKYDQSIYLPDNDVDSFMKDTELIDGTYIVCDWNSNVIKIFKRESVMSGYFFYSETKQHTLICEYEIVIGK